MKTYIVGELHPHENGSRKGQAGRPLDLRESLRASIKRFNLNGNASLAVVCCLFVVALVLVPTIALWKADAPTPVITPIENSAASSAITLIASIANSDDRRKGPQVYSVVTKEGEYIVVYSMYGIAICPKVKTK